ncbi:MAG: hypothetical protein GDA38_07585 [Hormoscilla sp. SP12CHS1]|nr:hypothetical protein [Hormoscilla sp. SP12CHS1]
MVERSVPSQRLPARKKAVYLVPRVSLGTLLEAQPRVPEAGGRASEEAENFSPRRRALFV